MAKDDKKPQQQVTVVEDSALAAENKKLRSIIERAVPGFNAVTVDQLLEKEGEVFVNARGQVVPEKYRGTIKYRIAQAHYRQGMYFEAGSVITITDEVPSRTWTRVDAPAQAAVELEQAMKPEAPVQSRASDKTV
jgi:hypothetical protein